MDKDKHAGDIYIRQVAMMVVVGGGDGGDNDNIDINDNKNNNVESERKAMHKANHEVGVNAARRGRVPVINRASDSI